MNGQAVSYVTRLLFQGAGCAGGDGVEQALPFMRVASDSAESRNPMSKRVSRSGYSNALRPRSG